MGPSLILFDVQTVVCPAWPGYLLNKIIIDVVCFFDFGLIHSDSSQRTYVYMIFLSSSLWPPFRRQPSLASFNQLMGLH
jgi:hypothetical protein